jgi:iron complex transport system substrate-binding protein
LQALLAVACAVLMTTAAAAQPARPQRIVSLNLCTDQLLLALTDRSRIAAVSWLATDDTLSVMASRAQGLPTVRASAEEVLSRNPDLVLVAPFAARGATDMLRRLGKPVLELTAAQDAEGLRAALRTLAAAVDERDRAEDIIQAFDRELARLRAAASGASDVSHPSALLYNVAGLVSGPGSLADAALVLAGYRNAAQDYRRDARGVVALEQIVARPPDLLVAGHTAGDYRTVQADNLRHPALRRLLERVPSLVLPQKYTICATPQLAQAVALLVAARPTGQRP